MNHVAKYFKSFFAYYKKNKKEVKNRDKKCEQNDQNEANKVSKEKTIFIESLISKCQLFLKTDYQYFVFIFNQK